MLNIQYHSKVTNAFIQQGH